MKKRERSHVGCRCTHLTFFRVRMFRDTESVRDVVRDISRDVIASATTTMRGGALTEANVTTRRARLFRIYWIYFDRSAPPNLTVLTLGTIRVRSGTLGRRGRTNGERTVNETRALTRSLAVHRVGRCTALHARSLTRFFVACQKTRARNIISV